MKPFTYLLAALLPGTMLAFVSLFFYWLSTIRWVLAGWFGPASFFAGVVSLLTYMFFIFGALSLIGE